LKKENLKARNEFFLTTPYVPDVIRKFLLDCFRSKIDFTKSYDELIPINESILDLCIVLQRDSDIYPYINVSNREKILSYLSDDDRSKLQKMEQEFICQHDRDESSSTLFVISEDAKLELCTVLSE
jgi:hypothetical protein